MWYTYLLQNKHGKLYTGATHDLQKRILMHNSSKNKSTKYGAPWKLVYCEIGLNKDDAFVREKYLKSGWEKDISKTD